MTQAIVYNLKLIQVEKQNRESIILPAFALLHGMFQSVEEQGPVGQSGQAVMIGVEDQLLLGSLEAGNFRKRACNPMWVGVTVSDRLTTRANPADTTIFVQHTVLKLQVVGQAIKVVSYGKLQTLAIIWVNNLQPVLQTGTDFTILVADDLLPTWRVIHPVLLKIPIPDAVVRALDREHIALLTLSQGFLHFMFI